MKPLLVLSLCAFLTACASTKYTDAPYAGGMYSKTVMVAYEGPLRPLSEVGMLTQDAVLQIRKITRDGQPVTSRTFKKNGIMYSTGRTQIHLLPGDYVGEFCFYVSDVNYTAWCTSPVIRPIKVVAGRVTHFTFFSAGRNNWSVRENDGTEDLHEIQADFTLLVPDAPK